MDAVTDLLTRSSRPLHGVQLESGDNAPASYGVAYRVALRAGQVAPPLEETLPLWTFEHSGPRHTTRYYLHQGEQHLVLSVDCEGRGRFAIGDREITVDWDGGTGPAHYLQGTALALWLERAGVPCIHANALALDGGRSVALLGPSGAGKSTLSAALLELGWQLLTDDMLALHRDSTGCLVFPGWPQLRLWPSSPAAPALEALPRVHRRFDKRRLELAQADDPGASRRLSHLLLLDRRDEQGGPVRVSPVAPGAALLHLLQNSMLGDAYRALGLESGRLRQLSALLATVPLLRLSYPSGASYLPAVAAALAEAVVAPSSATRVAAATGTEG